MSKHDEKKKQEAELRQEADATKREAEAAKTSEGGDLKAADVKPTDATFASRQAAAAEAIQIDPNAPAPGSWETEAMKKAREEREKAAAEAGADQRMSPVNPRKPLDKEPSYAPGVGPDIAAGPLGNPVPTDRRIPPENVSAVDTRPAPQQPSAPQPPPAATTHVITPAQAGLPQPELVAGRDPLPEEDPTPSTVPIPPPGPRRVA